MGLNFKNETPITQFEAIDLLTKKQNQLIDCCYLLESIMLNSDIDKDKESGGTSTWKKKIMNELMKHGYKWEGDTDTANKLFGDNYGIDWTF